MAKHADVKQLPVRRDNPKVFARKKEKHFPWQPINFILLLGLYVLMTKEWWLPFLTGGQ
jgi:hypothetical protein